MARSVFPSTNDSYVLSVGGFPQAGIPVKIWSRQVGGSQVTDLTFVGYDGSIGAAVPSGILYSDSNGLLPTFAGPDGGATTLWGDHGMSGERIALTSGPGAGGGGGGLTGTGGGSVTTTAGVAADAALTGTFAPGGTAGNVSLAQVGPAVGSDAWLKLHAGGNLDALITGAITRDSNGAATTAGVVWPDSTVGTYTATTVSTLFPGSVDAYSVTYGSPATKTASQPAVTRDAGTGAITTRPDMTVS